MTEFFVSVAPPEGALCDFCSSPDVHWLHPCRDHVTRENASAVVARGGEMHGSQLTATHASHGGWAACNACHMLIERGDRQRLARRSAKRFLKKHPEFVGVWSLANAVAHMSRTHAAFFANRAGEPTYFEERPKWE